MRAAVLAVLGVLKIATAAQIKALTRPDAKDTKAIRAALLDLQRHGLMVSEGRTQGPPGVIGRQAPGGQAKAHKLWRLTPAGLDAAAAVLPSGTAMGGTARGAGRTGAPHAMAVNDTVAAVSAPGVPGGGIGTIRSWATEFPHLLTARLSVIADAVLRAPEAGLPVLLVEVDRATETPARVADKLDRYRRFFQRTAKASDGRETPYWRTLYPPTGREGHPPVALVFTGAGPRALANRMKAVSDLSRAIWAGDRNPWRREEEAYTDYTDAVPVLATTLDRLQRHGPHGPVWWRYGHRDEQTLTDALDNPDGYTAWIEQSKARRESQLRDEYARRQADLREQQQLWEELEREETQERMEALEGLWDSSYGPRNSAAQRADDGGFPR